jgi:hypothetical protein
LNQKAVRLRHLATLIAAAGLAMAGCAGSKPKSASSSGAIGLFTTLPILWAESDDLRGLLRSDMPPHWALAVLRAHGEVKPVDSLMPTRDAPLLPGVSLLVMAQPRALAPQENVALDGWARRGGHLLLFADPLLTEESAFVFGDRRRPQDVALLSPILARWGLRLEFDESQAPGEKLVYFAGEPLPVNLPGRLVILDSARGCTLLAAGLAARCRIGKGRVLVIADAALLEKERGSGPEGHGEALDRLILEVDRDR